MNETAARIVLVVILSAGVLFWLVDLWLFVQMGRVPTQGTASHLLEGMAPDDVMQGVRKHVVGDVDVLSNSASELQIARSGLTGTFGVERSFGGTVLNVAWDAAPMGRKYLVLMAAFTLVLIPAALAGVTWLIWTLVIPSPNPAVRWQVLQEVQVIHVLWPPLLVWTLHVRLLTAQRRAIENLHFRILAERPAE